MDGCLTWLSKGFEDLGFVLYLAGKASKGVRLSAHSAGDSLGLALFNDRVTNELMSPPGPPPAPAGGPRAAQPPSQMQVVALGGRCPFPHSSTAPPSLDPRGRQLSQL